MINVITTIVEVAGASLIIYGVYTLNESLAYIVAGAFLIVGSYLISTRVYLIKKKIEMQLQAI